MACGYEHSVMLKYTTTCYGKTHDDTGICSGNGLCSSTDNCTCANGYSGNECQTYSCNGVLSSLSSVCSGYGTCIRSNECNCNSGHEGTNCEINMNLISFNHTKVYGFGKNADGQLGIGNIDNKNTPTLITSNNFGISKIYGGFKHSFIQNQYSTYSSGQNNV